MCPLQTEKVTHRWACVCVCVYAVCSYNSMKMLSTHTHKYFTFNWIPPYTIQELLFKNSQRVKTFVSISCLYSLKQPTKYVINLIYIYIYVCVSFVGWPSLCALGHSNNQIRLFCGSADKKHLIVSKRRQRCFCFGWLFICYCCWCTR